MDEIGLHTGDVRSRTSALIRERQDALAADVVSQITSLATALQPEDLHGCAELLLRLFAASVDAGTLDTDSAAIKPEGAQSIRTAAEAIKQAGARIAITGYTDRQGDLAHNQELAKTRAQAVRDALVRAGVPVANIEMRPPMTVEIGASGPDADARRVQIAPL